MELRSGRRLCSTSTQHVWLCSPDLGPDHISALPDDLLLLILARLRCVATAARTGVLSRRWRNLWMLLPVLVFRDVKYSSLEPALARLDGSSPVVSLLEIQVPKIWRHIPPGEPHPIVDVYLDAAGVTSLLHAAARLEPEALVFAIRNNIMHGHVDLPCFRRAASIVLESHTTMPFRVPAAGVEFAALDTLSLSGIIGLDDLISRCPCLRVLQLTVASKNHLVTVHSPSLQELSVNSIGCIRFDVVVPMLRRLNLSLLAYEEVSISILAPNVEIISWYCSYIHARRVANYFGRWRLIKTMLKTPARQGHLPSLHIHASICSPLFLDQVANFKLEIKKHMVAAFSALELHLMTSGHVFGAFVFHLIGMKRIRSVMRSLKVILRESKEKEECPTNCLCHPTNWKVQTITLIALEEMQIDGFEGDDHEYDFLKLVFKSAPMLKRLIVKLSHEDSSRSKVCTKLYHLFRAYLSVECFVYLSTGEYMSSIHD